MTSETNGLLIYKKETQKIMENKIINNNIRIQNTIRENERLNQNSNGI